MRRFAKIAIYDNKGQLMLWMMTLAIIVGALITLAI
jgi:hypothetical protein